jgi:serine protease Do
MRNFPRPCEGRGFCPRVIFGLLFAACFALPKMLVAQAPSTAISPDLLRQLSLASEALVRRVAPSVVQILAVGYGPLEEGSQTEAGLVIGRQRAIGSGVIVDPDGYIMTNAHVVSGAQRIQVVIPAADAEASPIRASTSRGTTVEAKIVGISREIDLALLKVEAHGLTALPIGNYRKLMQGEIVFAFGSPEGLRNSVTMGLVSAVARQPDPDNPMIFIQTDAAINPGNSGGPLVNVEGELVGMNTFILTQSGGNQGLGFAIPCGLVALAYPQLRKYGHVHRSQIGVSVQTITPALAAGLGLSRDRGVIVSDILPGGPADKAGLKIQDIIVSVDGRPIDSFPMFGYSFYLHHPGEPMKLEVLRDSTSLQLEVPVIEQPHKVDRLIDLTNPEKNLVEKLGILGIDVNKSVTDLLPELREPSGVIVVARAAASGNSETSLVTGDVIHAINGVPVISLEFLRFELERIKPDHPVVLQIEREGRLMYLSFQLEGP